ncbi:MAG TPA: hypothetical protein VFV19_03565 [Candidatus Polarisedimenticolaceae bacterium]|nr:hypothetical protein [Candidatus Polarisedimenticolaceae bacterium]
MEIYRIPTRETAVKLLLDDGRSLDGQLYTADTGPAGRPEHLLHHLNDPDTEFVPLASGRENILINKAGIVWAQFVGEAAEEIALDAEGGRRVPVRLSLTGGISLVGVLSIVMPPERSRVLDYLNAAGRFLPVFGEGAVTLVQRRFVVVARSAESGSGAS